MMQAITINDIPERAHYPKPLDRKIRIDGLTVELDLTDFNAMARVYIPSINYQVPGRNWGHSLSIFVWGDHFASVDEYVNEINQAITRLAEAAKLLGATPKAEAA